MEFTHRNDICSLAFSPNGSRQLVSGSKDCTVQVCDVATGSRLRLFEGHAKTVSCVAWSEKCDYLVSASVDDSIRVWKMQSIERKAMAVLERAHHGRGVRAVAFSRDGQLLVSGGNDGMVVIWKQVEPETWARKLID